MPASKRATEEASKLASKPASKPASKLASKSENKADPKVATKANEKPIPVEPPAGARPVASSTRKPSKTALSPSEVTPLALLTPNKPARRRRSGATKPRKLKGATATWPFPTGSRP